MIRMLVALLFVVIVAAAQAPASGAEPVGNCETLTRDEAQAELNRDPTYDTRFRLDPNENGIACETGERPRTRGGVADPGTAAQAGVGDPGARGAAGTSTTVNALPSTGSGPAVDPWIAVVALVLAGGWAARAATNRIRA